MVHHETQPPVAVGGVGGSGTRLVASLLAELDFYLGDDLNESLDNLWFTLLFKRREIWPLEKKTREIELAARIFSRAMSGQEQWPEDYANYIYAIASSDRPDHPAAWLAERAATLLAARPRELNHWGWKEPNTHIVLPLLRNVLPDMRYIHVVRHGLDMAYSANQGQVRLWGDVLAGVTDSSPASALRYWCASHERIRQLGQDMGDRFLWLDFDRLCEDPATHLPLLLDFVGVSVSPAHLIALTEKITPPASIGRYQSRPLTDFNSEDIERVRALGFEVRAAC